MDIINQDKDTKNNNIFLIICLIFNFLLIITLFTNFINLSNIIQISYFNLLKIIFNVTNPPFILLIFCISYVYTIFTAIYNIIKIFILILSDIQSKQINYIIKHYKNNKYIDIIFAIICIIPIILLSKIITDFNLHFTFGSILYIITCISLVFTNFICKEKIEYIINNINTIPKGLKDTK